MTQLTWNGRSRLHVNLLLGIIAINGEYTLLNSEEVLCMNTTQTSHKESPGLGQFSKDEIRWMKKFSNSIPFVKITLVVDLQLFEQIKLKI